MNLMPNKEKTYKMKDAAHNNIIGVLIFSGSIHNKFKYFFIIQ